MKRRFDKGSFSESSPESSSLDDGGESTKDQFSDVSPESSVQSSPLDGEAGSSESVMPSLLSTSDTNLLC